ncbi:MAG: (2Fe-2S)-binding protein [Deltaproteobacteria bacterium]|nr:(2Fe-2S)-binding protein [Deltaproteobacteria bacterium]
MPERISKNGTELIDRSKRVTLFYKGTPIQGFEGETIASVLTASGIKVFSRSFKYHRPRGMFCMSGHCSRCAMVVDGRPHVRTCHTPARDGMTVAPQGKAEETDFMAIADKMSWAMKTGFYYKMFYKPAWVWPIALKRIRSAPGGHAPIQMLDKKPRFDQVSLNPEMLVIGGGLAGLEAALVGARAGVRVVVVESQLQLGGLESLQGAAGKETVDALVKALAQCADVTLLTGTTASAMYAEGIIVATEQVYDDEGFMERTWMIRPKATVIATGAIGRPLSFAHNDRPGIILPEAAQRLVNHYSVKPGNRVLVAGGDDYTARVALDLARRQINVMGLADYRMNGLSDELEQELTAAGVPVMKRHAIAQSTGKKQVAGAQLVDLNTKSQTRVAADVIVASAGRTPLNRVLRQTGAKMIYDPTLNLHLPEEIPAGYYAAGRVLGLEDQDAIRAQGKLAGAQALVDLGIDATAAADEAEAALRAAPAITPVALQPEASANGKKTFICFCHDATAKDVSAALDEGFENIETAKRYTTATMGPCQGGMCMANFAQKLAEIRPNDLGNQTLTTPRNPLAPLTMGAMAAGHHDHPQMAPTHDVQVAAGAVLKRFGNWIRADHFGDPEGESMAVHETAALLDASTLGKFRVYGPDAVKLLNCVTTKRVDDLQPGKILYYAACNEEGVFIDDGAIIKQGENDFYVSTSTARAGTTMSWWGRWGREENWEAWVVNISDGIGVLNLSGPKARDILSKLTDADISNETLPFMACAEIDVAGVLVKILRMGFLGELSYELHIPTSQAAYVWTKLMAAGEPLGIKATGVEVQFICRLEKGHVLPGLDSDGNTTLLEAGFGWSWDKKNTGFVGEPMLQLLKDQPRKLQIIRFKLDGRSGIKDGNLVIEGPERLGYITSTRYSKVLDQTIGLALVKPHENFKKGGTATLLLNGAEKKAQIMGHAFYDPKGARMKI